MPQSGYVPGAAQPTPVLSRLAIEETTTPPENFIGQFILPDEQTASLLGKASVFGTEHLEVADDDLIGDKTDFPEIMWSEGETSWELGMHGRAATIGALAIEKAKQMVAFSGAGSDPLFDLEARVVSILVQQNLRRMELLKHRVFLNEALYPAGHVLDPIEIDTTDAFRQTLVSATRLVAASGQQANLIALGDTAVNGLELNENIKDLLADTSDKLITRTFIKQASRLPEDTTRVEFASSYYQAVPKGPLIPMMDRYIWVGVAKTTPDRKASFGRTWWMPCMENKQRVYTNRLLLGNQETRRHGLKNFYLPSPEDFSLGVLIPVTLSTD